MHALELYTDNQSLQTPQFCERYLLRGTVSALKQLVCAPLQGARRETCVSLVFQVPLTLDIYLRKAKKRLIESETLMRLQFCAVVTLQPKGRNVNGMGGLQGK